MVKAWLLVTVSAGDAAFENSSVAASGIRIASGRNICTGIDLSLGARYQHTTGGINADVKHNGYFWCFSLLTMFWISTRRSP